MKSDEAVLKAYYIGPFARSNGAWTPNNLWTRDDTILGGDQVKPLYLASRRQQDFDAALEEKKQALLLVESMFADFKEAQPLIKDKKLAEEAYNTLLYEKELVGVLDHYLSGLFYYYRWSDGGKKDSWLKQNAINRLKDWENAWAKYNRDIPPLPGVATLYKDRGMVAAASGALKELQQP